ncbi:MAG: shikimate dehydrogenase [Bryobacteraceae bacterium]
MPALPKSLPRVCVALGFPSAAQLAHAAEREYKDGNTFLEFRLDYLPEAMEGAGIISALRKTYPDVYVLATCRRHQQQGGFRESIERQLAVLSAAAQAGATAIDLEIESAECAKPAVQALREAAPVIVSYHNFDQTPAFAPIWRRLKNVPADAYKVAVTARKPTDNARLMRFMKENARAPLVALAMSDLGTVSRGLACSWGSLYTYAAPNCGDGTAAGQFPAKRMRSLYRCDKLTRLTRVYGVVADPVAHSKSPEIHNRAFQARRLDAVYLPFRVPPPLLSDWMKLALDLPVAGFSVTIPHKQRILRYLDKVDPLARRIGAVNTVWRKAGKWRGANTDAEGVLKPLSHHIRLARASVLIVGYGGGARAAAIALADAGAKVSITGRDPKSAQTLAHAAGTEAVALEDSKRRHYDALVHATPVGMSPHPEACLFEGDIPAEIVFDMVYNPHETLLLRRAKQQGRTVVYGSEMLIEQAASQFEIWTGESAPRSAMKAALEQGNC